MSCLLLETPFRQDCRKLALSMQTLQHVCASETLGAVSNITIVTRACHVKYARVMQPSALLRCFTMSTMFKDQACYIGRTLGAIEHHAWIKFANVYAGHLILGKQDVVATIHGSFLCASLEIGMLRRALMYVCELRQAKPRALGHPHNTPADSNMQASKLQLTQSATGSMMMAPSAAQAANARLPGGLGSGSAAGRVSVDASASAPQQSKAVKSSAAKSKRNLTVQVFLHCARIDVSSSPCLF